MIAVEKLFDNWKNILRLDVDVSCLHGSSVFGDRVSIIAPMPFVREKLTN